MFKYPRTRHVRGSRFQHGDHDMEAADWSELAGKHLVVEEKVDGANCGISFSEEGELLLQSRGHYLRGGPREKHFNLLKQWSACHQEAFYCALGSRYVMYGEWLYAKHTYFYDALPHYFMEFDVLDTATGDFLTTPARRKLLAQCPVTSVKVLHEGAIASAGALAKFIGRSNFITDERKTVFLSAAYDVGVLPNDSHFANKEIQEVLATGDWDTNMEGLYIKVEDGQQVLDRFKYVRQSFTNAILDQDQHWHDRPIIPNKLVDGAFERMFDV